MAVKKKKKSTENSRAVSNILLSVLISEEKKIIVPRHSLQWKQQATTPTSANSRILHVEGQLPMFLITGCVDGRVTSTPANCHVNCGSIVEILENNYTLAELICKTLS